MPSKSKNPIDRLVASWQKKQPTHPLLVVLGPTASGKTALAIQLAKKFDGEIISADSRQIYKELDLGTAKPSKKELAAAPHHLISTHSPRRVISTAAYRRLAERKIREIQKRGKLPILAGSHTLLISAIVENYIFPKVKLDPALREKLTQDYMKRGGAKRLWNKLKKINPAAAAKIPAENKYHLIRALELATNTNHRPPTKGRRKFNCLILGLNPPRKKLYAKINARVNTMLTVGLLDEVKRLAKKYDRLTPALRGHGYRELLDYLAGEKSLEQAVEEIKRDTRNYAKRQMTWLRNCGFTKEINWLTN